MSTVTIQGGEKLEAELARMTSKMGSGGSVKVGFLSGKTYPSGPRRSAASKSGKVRKTKAAASSGGGIPVAAVAAWNNFGTSRIPPRPFFSNMVAEKSPEWPKQIGIVLKANGYDVQKTLKTTGMRIKEQLEYAIISFTTPGNAPSTIARKGKDSPLRDTGTLLDSVGFRVDGA